MPVENLWGAGVNFQAQRRNTPNAPNASNAAQRLTLPTLPPAPGQNLNARQPNPPPSFGRRRPAHPHSLALTTSGAVDLANQQLPMRPRVALPNLDDDSSDWSSSPPSLPATPTRGSKRRAPPFPSTQASKRQRSHDKDKKDIFHFGHNNPDNGSGGAGAGAGAGLSINLVRFPETSILPVLLAAQE